MLAANPLSACNGPEGPAYPSTSFDSSMRTPFITVRRLASHIKHQHNTLRNRTRLSPLMHRHRVVLRHDCLCQPNHQIIQHTPFHSIPFLKPPRGVCGTALPTLHTRHGIDAFDAFDAFLPRNAARRVRSILLLSRMQQSTRCLHRGVLVLEMRGR